MATPSTVGALLAEHSSNPVHLTGFTSTTKKKWAADFVPIVEFAVHTHFSAGAVLADFDGAFHALCHEDDIRMARPAYPPNERAWRFDTEADVSNWFQQEISAPVLAAFGYPKVLQVSEAKPIAKESISETVDVLYTVSPPKGERLPALVIEMKRRLVDVGAWQSGRISVDDVVQYARKYNCPQIICFDGNVALMLQFRAHQVEAINDSKCDIDCWVIPRDNLGGCTLRYALYRFLVQGFRRCQALCADGKLSLDGVTPKFQYFSGQPEWKINGGYRDDPPSGWVRRVNANYGKIYYMKDTDPGTIIWETQGQFWNFEEAQAQQQQYQQRPTPLQQQPTLYQQLEGIDEESLYD